MDVELRLRRRGRRLERRQRRRLQVAEQQDGDPGAARRDAVGQLQLQLGGAVRGEVGRHLAAPRPEPAGVRAAEADEAAAPEGDLRGRRRALHPHAQDQPPARRRLLHDLHRLRQPGARVVEMFVEIKVGVVVGVGRRLRRRLPLRRRGRGEGGGFRRPGAVAEDRAAVERAVDRLGAVESADRVRALAGRLVAAPG